MELFIALCSIIMVNIVLSGDNAVVIAMASRRLPPKQQSKAILWGSAGAIVLRVLLTLIAIVLLQIPYLQFIGGVLLVWIAAKLLLENSCEEQIDASDNFWAAVKTIIIADLIMSLDNTLAIAAVANGNYILLAVGLALSIPLIICGSQLIMKVMNKYPVIVYAGAALIAWTAGEMMVRDQRLGMVILKYTPAWVLPVAVTAGVLGIGIWSQYGKEKEKPKDTAAGKMKNGAEQMIDH